MFIKVNVYTKVLTVGGDKINVGGTIFKVGGPNAMSLPTISYIAYYYLH